MKFLSLGEKIRKLRKEKGLTLEELSGSIATKSYLSLIENNKTVPKLDVLKHIANVLEIDLEQLIKDEKTQAKELCEIKIKEIQANIQIGNYESMEIEINNLINIVNNYSLNIQLGKLMELLGKLYLLKSDYGNSILHFEYSNKIFIEENYNNEKIIENYHQIANIYINQGRFNAAIEKYKIIENFYKLHEITNIQLKKEILYNYSICYYETGEFYKTIKYLNILEKLINQASMISESCKSMILKGKSCIKIGNYSEAEKAFDKALGLIKNKNDINNEAHLENNLGILYLKMGKEEKGLEHLKRAYILQKANNDSSIVETILNFVGHYIDKKEYKMAIEYLKEAQLYANNIIHLSKIYMFYYEFYLVTNDLSKAKEYILKSIKTFEENKYVEGLMIAYKKYSNLLEKEGNYVEGIKYLRKYLSLEKSSNINSLIFYKN